MLRKMFNDTFYTQSSENTEKQDCEKQNCNSTLKMQKAFLKHHCPSPDAKKIKEFHLHGTLEPLSYDACEDMRISMLETAKKCADVVPEGENIKYLQAAREIQCSPKHRDEMESYWNIFIETEKVGGGDVFEKSEQRNACDNLTDRLEETLNDWSRNFRK
jgi:hypothetical protein